MRLRSRRSPAGHVQVPRPPRAKPALVVWRLGPQHQLWDLTHLHVATVWYAAHNGWCRADWPADLSSRAPIAPLDISISHTLELTAPGGLVGYACVVGIESDAVIAYFAPDWNHIEAASGEVAATWRQQHVERTARRFQRRPW